MKDDIIKKLEKEGFQPEIAEIKREYFDYTGYPKPLKKYSLSFKSQNYSVEEMYNWMVGHATNDWGMPYVHKITDIFAASQSSSIFGDVQARLTAQQNQASQLLATTSAMTKDLFKRVRELRQIRERLAYYDMSSTKKPLSERKKSAARGAENTLKDTWITLVEGGGENAGSVYGMARKVEFTILPDLFFQAPPLKTEEIKEYVKSLDFNPAVKNAVERKLYQYNTWKENTYKELQFKEKFQKKLIYQHYQNVRTYLQWIRPYLKNIKKLGNNDDLMNSHAIISSFQTSLIEIEVLVQKPNKKISHPLKKGPISDQDKKHLIHNSVIILHFLYETNPSMDYHAKDAWNQKGPIHIGKVDANIRAYGWTDAEIEKYKKIKEEEDIALLEAIDYTLKDEQDLLGEDLKQVLDEVGKDLGKKLYNQVQEKQETLEEVKKKQKEFRGQALEPFTSIISGLKEIAIDPFFDTSGLFQSKPLDIKKTEDFKNAQKSAGGEAKTIAWQIYKNYKKAHRMFAW
jgi:hypothetical protein